MFSLCLSSKNNHSLRIRIFFVCLIIIFFTLSTDAAFSYYYNPLIQNLLLSPIITNFGYLGTTFTPSNSNTYSQNFSYNDYYAAYPYLQTQDSTNSSSTNSGTTNSVNNAVRYLPNSTSYTLGYTPQIYNTGTYSPYGTYQTLNTYQSSNYTSLSSNIYQTVPFYSSNSTTTQSQTSLPQTGTYGQSNTSTGTYLPAGQIGYYSPAQSQTSSPYSSSSYPNVYIPANTYTQNQTTVNGYYYPNSNYWPASQISTNSSKPPAEINGEYRGEWASDTSSISGQICFAEIDQFDTQIEGEIKLKEFTIGTNGKTNITGAVNGDTVNLEINLNGPVLIFEGTVQSNGSIFGNYTVQGSSGSILDEGSLTLTLR